MRRNWLALPLAMLLLASASSFAQTFQKTQTISTSGPRFAKLADVNNDGKLDLLYTDSVTLSIRLGNGDGTFATTGPDYQLYSLYELETPDLNKDGKLDLVTTEDVAEIRAFRGNGDGTFTQTYGAGSIACTNSDNTNSLSAVDFNGDGKIDVVASTSCYALVFLGRGDGTFDNDYVLNNASGSDLHDLEAGDFDHDGKMDVAFVVTTADNNQDLYVAYGDGTGQVGPRQLVAHGTFQNLKVKDLNHDGHADILANSEQACDVCDFTPEAFFWHSTGWTSRPLNGTLDYLQRDVNFGDFNGDGLEDVIAPAYSQSTNSSRPDGVFLSIQNADQTFQTAKFISLAPNRTLLPDSLAVGDLDGDKKLDLVLTSYETNQIQVFKNTTPASSCSAPTTADTVHFCSPTNGSTVTNPVHILATGSNAHGITGSKVYVNGSGVYSGPSGTATIDISQTLPQGTDKITAKFWDTQGHVFSSSVTVTVGTSTTCTASSSEVAKICAPSAGSTVSSPVQVTAAAYNTGTLTGFKLYLDGTSVYYQGSGTWKISTQVSAGPGTHHMTAKWWHSDGSAVSRSVDFTVQ